MSNQSGASTIIRKRIALRDNDSITMYHHPDALYDRPYEEKKLFPGGYIPFQGNFTIKNNDKLGVTLATEHGECIRVDACAPKIIRVKASPVNSRVETSTTATLGLINEDWVGVPFSYSNDEEQFCLQTADLKLVLDHRTKDIHILDSKEGKLIEAIKGGLRFSPEKPDYGGHSFLSFFNFENESVFGFGGRIMKPDRSGTTVDIFSEKVGVISGDYGGCPVPFFISTKGYGLFLNNPWPHVYFDMGKSRTNEWFFHAPGGECEIYIMYGPEFKDIMNSYTHITGRIPVPPKSLFGFWCSSLAFNTAKDVLDVAARLRKEGWPADIMVVDGPWRGGPDFIEYYASHHKYISNDINWHPDFGDGPKLLRQLEAMEFKTSLHLNSRNFKPSTEKNALDKGLLRKYGDEIVVKVTDEKSEQYYEKLLRPRIDEGVSVWWTDHSDRVSGEIKEGVPSRNLFGALWNQLLARIMEKNGHQNHLSLTRGSGIGGQKYGMPWPGDTRVGIDYYEEDIWFCLSAGLAGFSLTSVDLGGFTVKNAEADEAQKHKEAFDLDNICRRLCQSIFFIPIPRIHNNSCHLPKLPWNCPAATHSLYKKFLELRYKFTPYIYSYAIHSSKSGEPILRPLVYHYQNDKTTYDIGDEFFMGDSLLIAPVTKKDQVVRNVYLPEGNWTHFWTEEIFEGPATVVIEVPMFDVSGLPIFVKSGAIIPSQPPVKFLKEDIPQNLTFDVYPDGRSAIDLHESATITNRITCNATKQDINLQFENNSGKARNYTFVLHGLEHVKSILLNNQPVDKPIEVNSKKKLATVKFGIEKLSTMSITLVKGKETAKLHVPA